MAELVAQNTAVTDCSAQLAHVDDHCTSDATTTMDSVKRVTNLSTGWKGTGPTTTRVRMLVTGTNRWKSVLTLQCVDARVAKR